MIPPRDSIPKLAPAPLRDFPALRRILPFTLVYRMRVAGAMLALLVASATVLGLGQGLRRLVDDGFKSADAATLEFRAVLRGDKLRKAPAPLTRNDRAQGARRRRSWRGAFDAGARCELIALRRRVELGLSDYIGG